MTILTKHAIGRNTDKDSGGPEANFLMKILSVSLSRKYHANGKKRRQR
jgi:hypothetical protein